MEDLEDADTKLLQVRLVGQVRLEDAWLSEDEDERGHEPLEKDRVCLAGDIMVEAVAQRRGSFDLLLQLCEGVRLSAWPCHRRCQRRRRTHLSPGCSAS